MSLNKLILYTTISILTAMTGILSPAHAQTAGDKASIEDIRKETRDLLTAFRSYTIQQQDEAIRKAKAALDRLDQRIDELETRIDNEWDKMNEAVREKTRSNLKLLRKQRVKVAEWYGSLKSSTADAWDHLRDGFSNAYKAFYDSWEKAEEEFDAKR